MQWQLDLNTVVNILLPALFGWAAWSAKKWVQAIVDEMNAKLEERTKPIQPTANGGKSLPDAIVLLTNVDNKVDGVHDRVDALHEKVNNVARDFEHLRGRFDQHMEWNEEERRRYPTL